MITTKIHGYLDYAMGALLIALPFLFGFPDGAPTTLLIVLGAGTILYSLLTKYELGAFGVIPMKVHLGIDIIAGAFLIISPWLFGFSDEILWPFIILGIIELGAALMTAKNPRYPEAPKT